ncbi:pentatricopeptide repeat-containing protein At1g71210, mitochondrial [Vitis riparia]|uniref:Pentatricopeptide repeat-containing protein, mitochondrial n=1 Tax=Vitis vinifera TaxID=29760 RepID=F6HTM9_VITVI|nr:pentatricopeptide repeat-containing protein At1g71210, mitochondrial [Vitis vinifera]XP_010648201.1 pentatricopeptide repeat-containing protein At1g71210, mitochondrial [Vitis vinifera]XP_034681842.1 pentatricopeptide repeat-containing protein At1g71210, mitochondrial [Vitis riparia]|eukprot:XP_002269136.1 PREDICTED: pentatricopeptide repeat-containing protein At1g71210 [Vitis vinifera]
MLRTKLSSTNPPRVFRVLRVLGVSISTSTVSPTTPASPPHNHLLPRHNPVVLGGIGSLQAKDVVLSFKQWFKSPQNILLMDQIFRILSDLPPDDADAALGRLRLPLSERFVLDVLAHGSDVLSCLKFFDWAGRQPGFHHTRATFHATFKILARAKLMSLMLDFLQNYTELRYVHRVRFYDTLVMGYAVAGKPEIALQLFAKMRFQGLDLDSFAYHVLLNALVEENCFDAFRVVVEQIRMRGLDNEITHSIIVKNFCKQGQLDEAKAFVEQLVESGRVGLSGGHMVGLIVDALCKRKRFGEAGRLVEEFQGSGMVSVEQAYGVWIRDLVRAGRLDGALEFLHSKKESEGYVPEVCGYNILICRLLRENRLEEVLDLLMEMREGQILPDKVTMNAVLCFFCKAGMVDVALELYNSRAEFGLSPNSMAYNYLINTLCGDGSTDEAYHVLKHSLEQGYFPGKKTFSILADALCQEGKLDKMKELVLVALDRNIMPSASTYDKFILALCKARRVDDGYLIQGELNKINKVASKNTYFNMIRGFNILNRADIAARLLIELQEKGHTPTRSLFRAVICRLCDMDNAEKQFLKLLELQLSHQEPNCQVYNFFIDGAGHAKKPELAREVFEMMVRSGIVPNLSSDILMLQSYLKNERISDALNFFSDLQKRRKVGRKLCNTMVVGLCKANKVDIALEILKEIREKGVTPSLECYEELVKVLCTNKRYDVVVNLIDDLERVGRHVSSFIGNVLLLHSLKTPELFETWVHAKDAHNEISSPNLILGQLIGEFSGCIGVNQDFNYLEEVMQQCFPLDLYTYNMLLRRLTRSDMDLALELFNRICQKGYEPNRWTYDILVHGLFKHGRTSEANKWVEEMFCKGFEPTEATKLLI